MPVRGTDDNTTLTGDDSLVATTEVLDSSVRDEKVILDRESDDYYGLNPVGAHLWERLAQPHTVDELVASTAEEFDVAADDCRDDVYEFLKDLLNAGLITRA